MTSKTINYLKRKFWCLIFKILKIWKLPADFNSEIYLKLNPDVKELDVHPAKHYYRYGKREKRPYKYLPPNILPGSNFDPKKANILIVTHEASRTGAPIIALNLIQSFSKRYNVIVLILGPGILIENFKAAAAAVIFEPDIKQFNQIQIANYKINAICNQHELLFALVNSIESHFVLQALACHDIPNLILIHEFAAYIRPKNAFYESFFWSTRAVFSSRLTLENALALNSELNNCPVEIIPQGKCFIPKDTVSTEQDEKCSNIINLIRPDGESDTSIIILGAGTLSIRKGIELFIECATRIVQSYNEKNCRFVWIGSESNPETNITYTVYITDQIQRANLTKHMIFIEETDEIELAYQTADLFLLSSRLDPLPNVAIEAMYYGLPIVCFEKASGIAEFLIQNNLGEHCVANYLDTSELSKKIVKLLESETLRKQVGDLCKSVAKKIFRLENYISILENLGLCVLDQMKQEKEDTLEILNSNCFEANFSDEKNLQETELVAMRRYIRGWKVGFHLRKPYPGFHPGIYIEKHGLTNKNSDPFADYLRNGRPQGPWNYTVIFPEKSRKLCITPIKAALHIHAYYPDLLPEIIQRIELNENIPDLYISVKDKASLSLVKDILSKYPGEVKDIQIVQNRGNISPLLITFGEKLIENYKFIGHIHTKKNPNCQKHVFMKGCKNFTFENLLGGKFGGQMADTILSIMNNNKNLAIVYPDSPNVIGWTINKPLGKEITKEFDIDLPEAFNFPMGMMFWIRASALKPFVQLKLDWKNFPTEPLASDGTILHALERLFGLLPLSNGMQYAVTHVYG